MASVTIAFNNAPSTEGHQFFQLCGDKARELCAENKHEYFLLTPPTLLSHHFSKRMDNDTVCVIAAHGDAGAIYNEYEQEVISIRTTNYNLGDKTVYVVSCHCAQHLGEELRRIGVKIFVGYNGVFNIGSEEDLFIDSALSGLQSLLRGNTLETSKNDMVSSYTNAIDNAIQNVDKWLLLDNMEHLVFIGDPLACI